MWVRDIQDPTYTVVINGRTLGEVRRPVDRRVFGRARGTVYVARPVMKPLSRSDTVERCA